MFKKLSSLILALALVASLAACGGNASSVPETPESTPAVTESTPAEELGEQNGEEAAEPEGAANATDRAGNPITLPETVDTIISMAPATTQVLIDLGLAEKIVAVDNESSWMYADALPEGVLEFEMTAPDIEQTLLLNPDIIFNSALTSGGGDDPFDQIASEGICVAGIPTPSDLAGIWEDVRFIAACVGMEAEGEALVTDAIATIEAVAAIGAEIAEKKTVLFEISALPYIYSFGPGVYLDEVLALVGAENVLTDAGWLPVSEEAAVDANPDVILTNVSYLDDSVAEILSREGWQSVTAVANSDVYYVDNAASSLPNHHVAEAVVEIAKAIYPEEYAGL